MACSGTALLFTYVLAVIKVLTPAISNHIFIKEICGSAAEISVLTFLPSSYSSQTEQQDLTPSGASYHQWQVLLEVGLQLVLV
jgi:hypothetical protein